MAEEGGKHREGPRERVGVDDPKSSSHACNSRPIGRNAARDDGRTSIQSKTERAVLLVAGEQGEYG